MTIQITILHVNLTEAQLATMRFVIKCIMRHYISATSGNKNSVNFTIATERVSSRIISTRKALIVINAPASKSVTEDVRLELVTAVNKHLNGVYADTSVCAELRVRQPGNYATPQLFGQTVRRLLGRSSELANMDNVLLKYRVEHELVSSED